MWIIKHSIQRVHNLANEINTNSPLKVALLGLGKAGWKSDFDKGTIGKSHAYSIINQKTFILVVGVDKDPKALLEWKSRFDLPSEISIWRALDSYAVDIVVISTPIKTLFDYLKELVSKYPKILIIIEKPVVANLDEAHELRRFMQSTKGNVLVNLPRLFAKETYELKSFVEMKLLKSIHGSYSGDFVNTGLHFISLLNFLFGKINLIKSDQEANPIIEIYQNSNFLGRISHDPSIVTSSFDLVFNFEDTQVNYFNGGEDISLISKSGVQILENTRALYQLNVYNYIAKNGFHKAIKLSGLEEISPSIFQMFGMIE